jgi:hypothetical protein
MEFPKNFSEIAGNQSLDELAADGSHGLIGHIPDVVGSVHPRAMVLRRTSGQIMEHTAMTLQSAGRVTSALSMIPWDRLLQLGHALLRGFVNAQGTGDLGATLEYEGRLLNRLDELYDRRYVSIFGELLIRRIAYGIEALPWLILTDKTHIVQAEGLNLDELLDSVSMAGGPIMRMRLEVGEHEMKIASEIVQTILSCKYG